MQNHDHQTTDHRRRHSTRDAADAARRAESAAILERLQQETDPQIGAHAARIATGAGRHFAGADADPADRIEVWGTRIGRALGLVGFLVLGLLLAWQVLA